jgi:hypothetical protein
VVCDHDAEPFVVCGVKMPSVSLELMWAPASMKGQERASATAAYRRARPWDLSSAPASSSA